MLRKLISLALSLLTPCFLIAQETGAGLLHGTGSAYLNGAPLLTNSAAVTVGDVIETRETGVGTLSASGSSVVVESNTIARFQSGGVALDRGSVLVATGKGLSISARDFKIMPASGEWTEFYVTRVSGVIQITARKNSVTLNCGANTTTVQEGRQISRYDAPDCGTAQTGGGGAPTAAKGPILSSRTAEYAGLAAAGVLTVWALAHSDDPVSPSAP